jgi:putative transposase
MKDAIPVSAGWAPGGFGDESSGVTSAPPGITPASSETASVVPAIAAGTTASLVELSDDELTRLGEIAAILRHESTSDAAQILGWSPRRVARKRRALDALGLAALKRKRRSDRGRSRVADDALIARAQAEYLRPWRPKISQVHRAIAADLARSGLPAPSYQFVRRAIQRIDPDLVARYRIGEREFDDRYAYITLRRKPSRPRQWCDADHHPCDHLVVFDDGSIGRPWLTAIQDICTDEILGIYLTREKPVGKGTYPGAEAIGLCLRHALLAKDDPGWPSRGVFEILYADLGRDFRSRYVRSICNDLGIKIVHTRGYHGKSKPIERWFGVMEDALRYLPGYVGSSPDNNPMRQSLRPSSVDRQSLLTIDGFERELTSWIVRTFHHAASRALHGLSPLEALEAHARSGFVAREICDERALDLLLMRRAGKRVRNAGIQHFGRWFFDPALLPLVGREVEIAWDPARVGELVVYHDGRFICVAHNRQLVDFGASEDTLRREREIKRQQREDLRRRYEEIIRRQQHPDALARAKAEEMEKKILDEEREKIAVGAQSIPVLIPRFQRAAKAINKKQMSRQLTPKHVERALDDVPSGEMMFKRERNPWLEE